MSDCNLIVEVEW